MFHLADIDHNYRLSLSEFRHVFFEFDRNREHSLHVYSHKVEFSKARKISLQVYMFRLISKQFSNTQQDLFNNVKDI